MGACPKKTKDTKKMIDHENALHIRHSYSGKFKSLFFFLDEAQNDNL
ncbi:MAG: hypothetical protein CNLJKLNK_00722 [Holosporales bacterium]